MCYEWATFIVSSEFSPTLLCIADFREVTNVLSVRNVTEMMTALVTTPFGSHVNFIDHGRSRLPGVGVGPPGVSDRASCTTDIVRVTPPATTSMVPVR